MFQLLLFAGILVFVLLCLVRLASMFEQWILGLRDRYCRIPLYTF